MCLPILHTTDWFGVLLPELQQGSSFPSFQSKLVLLPEKMSMKTNGNLFTFIENAHLTVKRNGNGFAK